MSRLAPDLPAAPKPVLAYDRIDENRRKTALLLIVFAVAAIAPFLLFVLNFLGSTVAMLVGAAFRYEEESLRTVLSISFAAAAVLAIAATAFAYRRSAGLILRIAGARPLSRNGAPGLRRTVENLCIGAGLPPPRLYVIASDATNLASTGLSRDDASLVVTRGALELLEPRELEGVVAQELSQIGNEDVRTATVVGALVSLTWYPLLVVHLLAGLWRAIGRFAGSTGTPWLVAAGIGVLVLFPVLVPLVYLMMVLMLMPLVLLVASPFAILTSLQMIELDPSAGWTLLSISVLTTYAFYGPPLIGLVIRRRLGRRQELRADADALVLTRHPTGLARALAKMTAGDNARLPVNPAIAHLFLVEPLRPGLPRRLLSTHPPVEQRISALVSMAGADPREIDEARGEGLAWHQRREWSGPASKGFGRGPRGIGARPPPGASSGATEDEPGATIPGFVERDRPPVLAGPYDDSPPPPVSSATLCGLVRDSTTEYLDDRADAGLASKIRAHLPSCPRCDDYITRRMYERITSG